MSNVYDFTRVNPLWILGPQFSEARVDIPSVLHLIALGHGVTSDHTTDIFFLNKSSQLRITCIKRKELFIF